MKKIHDRSALPALGIRHLSLIAALGHTHSLSEAAKQMRITQSALSHRLREAERRLGFKIYEKRGKGVALTVAGERLRPTAQRLLDDLSRAEAEAQNTDTSFGQHRVIFGQAHYSQMHWAADFANWLQGVEPAIKLEFHERFGSSTIKDLLSRDIDVLLSPTDPTHPELLSLRLGTDYLVAVSSPRHDWTLKEVVLPPDIVNETFLTYSFDITPDFENARFMQPSNCFPKHSVTLGNSDAVVEFVSAGMGVSVLLNWPLTRDIDQGHIVSRHLALSENEEAGISVDWFAVVRRPNSPDSVPDTAANLLKTWASETNVFPTLT